AYSRKSRRASSISAEVWASVNSIGLTCQQPTVRGAQLVRLTREDCRITWPALRSGFCRKTKLGLTPCIRPSHCNIAMLRSLSLPVLTYAVNEEPQPQLPVAFGFLNVKPEPITFVT